MEIRFHEGLPRRVPSTRLVKTTSELVYGNMEYKEPYFRENGILQEPQIRCTRLNRIVEDSRAISKNVETLYSK